MYTICPAEARRSRWRFVLDFLVNAALKLWGSVRSDCRSRSCRDRHVVLLTVPARAVARAADQRAAAGAALCGDGGGGGGGNGRAAALCRPPCRVRCPSSHVMQLCCCGNTKEKQPVSARPEALACSLPPDRFSFTFTKAALQNQCVAECAAVWAAWARLKRCDLRMRQTDSRGTICICSRAVFEGDGRRGLPPVPKRPLTQAAPFHLSASNAPPAPPPPQDAPFVFAARCGAMRTTGFTAVTQVVGQPVLQYVTVNRFTQSESPVKHPAGRSHAFMSGAS
jgi:hypothetical protein